MTFRSIPLPTLRDLFIEVLIATLTGAVLGVVTVLLLGVVP